MENKIEDEKDNDELNEIIIVYNWRRAIMRF
jgi:hypothetical protein